MCRCRCFRGKGAGSTWNGPKWLNGSSGLVGAPMLTKLGPISASDFGQHSPTLAQVEPNSTWFSKIWPRLSDFGQNIDQGCSDLGKFGRCWPISDHVRPASPGFARNSIETDQIGARQAVDPIRPDLDRFRSKSGRCPSNLTAEVGQIWADFARHRPDLDRSWPNLDRVRPSLGRT